MCAQRTFSGFRLEINKGLNPGGSARRGFGFRRGAIPADSTEPEGFPTLVLALLFILRTTNEKKTAVAPPTEGAIPDALKGRKGLPAFPITPRLCGRQRKEKERLRLAPTPASRVCGLSVADSEEPAIGPESSRRSAERPIHRGEEGLPSSSRSVSRGYMHGLIFETEHKEYCLLSRLHCWWCPSVNS